VPQYIAEDPFDIETDPAAMPRIKSRYRMESAHYYNYGDRPLRVGNKLHRQEPHADAHEVHVVRQFQLDPGQSQVASRLCHEHAAPDRCVAVNEWWWSASCEYADIVFPADSWMEFKFPDMTAAVTNPFYQVFPKTPLKRLHDTRSDIEMHAGVGAALAKLTGDDRFLDYWKFVHEDNVEVYLQRIVDNSSTLRGYQFDEVHAKCQGGHSVAADDPDLSEDHGLGAVQRRRAALHQVGPPGVLPRRGRVPRARRELPVHREPVDGTFYEPNVIVCGAPKLIRPAGARKPTGSTPTIRRSRSARSATWSSSRWI
jgi:nitrate reductase / nitrite oxidoreductase, alpha subunit